MSWPALFDDDKERYCHEDEGGGDGDERCDIAVSLDDGVESDEEYCECCEPESDADAGDDTSFGHGGDVYDERVVEYDAELVYEVCDHE